MSATASKRSSGVDETIELPIVRRQKVSPPFPNAEALWAEMFGTTPPWAAPQQEEGSS